MKGGILMRAISEEVQERHLELFGENKVSRGKYRARLAIQVKQARKTRGLTQQELADIIGASKATIVRIEMGRANPRGDTLSNISIALETPLTIDSTESLR